MIKLPQTEELRNLARRMVWYKSEEQTLAESDLLIAHVMQYGRTQDVVTLLSYVSKDTIAKRLDHLPVGILDQRAWHYWNIVCGRNPVPAMPTRDFKQANDPSKQDRAFR